MFLNNMPGANNRQQGNASSITPIASSVVIKSLADMQSQLASAIDEQIRAYPPPGPKSTSPPEYVAAWCGFPRSCKCWACGASFAWQR